jgi:hypothetical protein
VKTKSKKNPVDPADTGSLSVQTISADGTAPKMRIATASAAYTAYYKHWQANVRRDQRFGDIAGIYSGFPPIPPVSLERNGQAEMPNINTKQFQAKLNTYVSTWTAINAQGDGFAEVKLKHDDPMEAERRSKVVTEEFNDAIRLWGIQDEQDFQAGSEYVLECSARDTQMGMFAVGLAYFRDSIDFRFRMIPTRRVYVAEGTRLTLDNCAAMFIQDSMSVTDLYAMRDKPGWNSDAILRNLYDHVEYRAPGLNHQCSYSEWVNEVRNNDTWLLNDFRPVTLIHGFVKEFDGTITQMTFTDLYGTGRSGDSLNSKNSKYKEDSDGFLFLKTKVATRWRQIIVPFADNAGPECDWHGVKGFGDLIFDGCHQNNQMYCKAAAGAIMTNLLMFQGASESDTQKMDQITFTQFGLMAPGLQLEQVRFQADIEGALSLFNVGSQIMSENTRIAPQNQKTVTNEQPTATQVQADRADRAQFTTLQIAIYRAVGQDVLFGEMYRRIAQPAAKYPDSWAGGKVAKRFRDNCAKRGIPEADLLKVKLVRANRNVGSGDLALDLMKADQLISVATPGKGQLNARKEKVAALKGVEMVSAFIEDTPQPGPTEAQIANENNIIQLGQIPTAFGWQDQEAHATGHLQLLGQATQAASQIMEQGIGPDAIEGAKKLGNLMDAGIQHVGQHIGLMQQVPRIGKTPALYENFLAAVTKQLHNVQQIHDALVKDIARIDQQAQPQLTPEQMKAQQDMQIKAAQAQQDLQLSTQKAHQKLGIAATQAKAKIEMAMTQHQTKLAIEADKSRENLKHKEAETAVSLHDKSLKTHQELAANAALTIQDMMHAKAGHEQTMAQEQQLAAAASEPTDQ